nr:MAG TPA: hypothetical protein [Caudoviricetes sp.]
MERFWFSIITYNSKIIKYFMCLWIISNNKFKFKWMLLTIPITRIYCI